MIRKKINKLIKNLLEKLTLTDRFKLSKEEKRLIDFYKSTLKNIYVKISDMYLKFGDNVDFSTMAKYNRLINLYNLITRELGEQFNISKTEINSFLKNSFVFEYKEVNKIFSKTLNIDFSFLTINKNVILLALENTDNKFSPLYFIKWQDSLKNAHKIAAKDIQNEIAQGLIQGKGYAKTAGAIKDRVEQLTNNVIRIVRTESHRIQTKARLKEFDEIQKSFKKLGIKSQRTLVSVLDQRTREQSREMDGQIADKNNMFTYPNLQGKVKAPGPGLTGVAKWDINDRETVILEII